MGHGPSVKNISNGLRIHIEHAKELKKLMQGTHFPKNYDRGDTQVEATMKYANKIMNAYGVEGLRDENAWVDRYWQNTIALYVNKGDTYITTLLYDTENDKYVITSWGNFYENWLYKHQKDLE